MYKFDKPSVYQKAKCLTHLGHFAHIDPAQPPTQTKPWRSILFDLDCVHRVDLVLPTKAFERLKSVGTDTEATSLVWTPPPSYRVRMSLAEILDGAFFRDHVKMGGVMMLSQSRPTDENVFTLVNGTLTMHLDMETYQRAGLVGEMVNTKANRKERPRWVVKYDLRQPSMFHGKKGFDRLLYACRNVLNQPITWLFCNIASTVPNPDPIVNFSHVPLSPVSTTSVIQAKSINFSTVLASLESLSTEDYNDSMYNIHEWLSLLRIDSPRVHANDDIDPYLSQYSLQDQASKPVKITRLSWTSFIPNKWVYALLLHLQQNVGLETWYSLSVSTLDKGIAGPGSDTTVLRFPGPRNIYGLWEVKQLHP